MYEAECNAFQQVSWMILIPHKPQWHCGEELYSSFWQWRVVTLTVSYISRPVTSGTCYTLTIPVMHHTSPRTGTETSSRLDYYNCAQTQQLQCKLTYFDLIVPHVRVPIMMSLHIKKLILIVCHFLIKPFIFIKNLYELHWTCWKLIVMLRI